MDCEGKIQSNSINRRMFVEIVTNKRKTIGVAGYNSQSATIFYRPFILYVFKNLFSG